VAGFGAAIVLDVLDRRERLAAQERTSVRADRFTKQLQSAIRDVVTISDELQREADEARRTVEQLRQDAETYDALAKVNRQEAEAVARLVRSEMQTEGRRTFRSGVAVNFVFFMAGVIVTVVFARLGIAG